LAPGPASRGDADPRPFPKAEARARRALGSPAPVAFLPCGGAKGPRFADVKAQGKSVIRLFTEERIITERYWPEE
jgi:hypothetical protein